MVQTDNQTISQWIALAFVQPQQLTECKTDAHHNLTHQTIVRAQSTE